MIIGGVSSLGAEHDELLEVEGIDLKYNSSTCERTIPSFPHSLKGSVGTFIDGAPIVCGGTINNDIDGCYRLNLVSNKWELSIKYPFLKNRS